MKTAATLLALLTSVVVLLGGTVEEYAANIAPQIDPAKLRTLGPRKANERVQRVTYWLATAKAKGVSPSRVADAALKSVGMTNALAAQLTKARMLANLDTAAAHGCVNAEGLDEMRRGRAATIRRGRYAGQELSVDHTLPFAVVPELDRVIANLALMPQSENSRKNSKIGWRQQEFAKKLHAAGLLSEAGLRAIQRR